MREVFFIHCFSFYFIYYHLVLVKYFEGLHDTMDEKWKDRQSEIAFLIFHLINIVNLCRKYKSFFTRMLPIICQVNFSAIDKHSSSTLNIHLHAFRQFRLNPTICFKRKTKHNTESQKYLKILKITRLCLGDNRSSPRSDLQFQMVVDQGWYTPQFPWEDLWTLPWSWPLAWP